MNFLKIKDVSIPILQIHLRPPPSLIFPLISRKENLSPSSDQVVVGKQPYFRLLQV